MTGNETEQTHKDVLQFNRRLSLASVLGGSGPPMTEGHSRMRLPGAWTPAADARVWSARQHRVAHAYIAACRCLRWKPACRFYGV